MKNDGTFWLVEVHDSVIVFEKVDLIYAREGLYIVLFDDWLEFVIVIDLIVRLDEWFYTWV